MSTITPAKVYTSVKEAVQAGASVTAEELEIANAYAKKAKRGVIKDAVIKTTRNTKNAGVMCPGSEKHPNCDRPAVVHGLCMREFIAIYRTDPANRERANKASREYAARQRALKAAAKS